jgi:hypothetical protein
MRVRYFCNQCDNLFVSGEQACSKCGQDKGPETRRDPYVYSLSQHFVSVMLIIVQSEETKT